MITKLKPIQLEAIQLMAQNMSNLAIAEQLKVSHITISRWRRKPEFQAELQRVMEDFRGNIHARLFRLADLSIDMLETMVEQEKQRPQNAYNTAVRIINILGAQHFALPGPSGEPPQTPHA